MVALRRAEVPDLARLTEDLRDWPCALQPDNQENPDIIMMKAPFGWAVCALMRVPIPWSELEWPAQSAAWRCQTQRRKREGGCGTDHRPLV